MASTQMQRRTTSTPSPFGLFPLLARDMDLLQENMRRILQGNQGQGANVASSLPQSLNWVPPVEIRETDDELTISAELAGVDADAVAITIDDDVLTISGVKADEREDRDEDSQYYLVERTYGEFRRSFTLPSTVDPDTVEADFDNGVLRIHLKKRDTARQRGRQIPINASGNTRSVGAGGGAARGSQRGGVGAGAGSANFGSTGGGMVAGGAGDAGTGTGGAATSTSGGGMSASGATSGDAGATGRTGTGGRSGKGSAAGDTGMNASGGGTSGSTGRTGGGRSGPGLPASLRQPVRAS